ncbi:MAG: hypothetical protein ACRDJH_18140 [Thermomicrobiales bacterium]
MSATALTATGPNSAPSASAWLWPGAVQAPLDRQHRGRRRFGFERLAAALLIVTAVTGFLAFRFIPPDEQRGATIPAPQLAGPGTPEAVDPSECTVEPRAIENVLRIFAAQPLSSTPAIDSAMPPTLPPDLPSGPQPDPQTVAAVAATWHEYWACYYAGDRLRQLALESDEAARRDYGHLPVRELVSLLAQPAEARLGPMVVPWPLYDFRVLPDGRVGALAYIPPDVGGDEYRGRDHVIFVKVGERWFIDAAVLPTTMG